MTDLFYISVVGLAVLGMGAAVLHDVWRRWQLWNYIKKDEDMEDPQVMRLDYMKFSIESKQKTDEVDNQ